MNRRNKSFKPNDLGTFLVESCQKIRVTDFIKNYKRGLQEATIKSRINVSGVDVGLASSKTRFGGIRIWFACPLCKKRIGVLYKHPINDLLGCRNCLNLEYRKRRYKGMVENNLLQNTKNSII